MLILTIKLYSRKTYLIRLKLTLITKPEHLKTCCSYKTTDFALIHKQLENEPILAQQLATRPHLFSSTMVFISKDQFENILNTISSIEEVINSTPYKNMVLKTSPSIAITDHGPKGVFMGYDFHLTEEGPKLIEINTNAGGSILNILLVRAQINCNKELNSTVDFEGIVYDMFLNEWKTQRKNEELKTIAIVDENPESQYLYPEFLLFQKLFLSKGKKCIITDPQELKWEHQQLWYKDEIIDMVYNRLTDFYLKDPKNEQLLNAFKNNHIVLTPSPYHHALYANKSNLVTLSSPSLLEKLEVSSIDIEILKQGIPKTEAVTSINAEKIWDRRKNLFFKPFQGFGGKATYRGDKLTHKVWQEILKNQYVAQEYIPPCSRLINERDELKFDIRAYVYEGKIQLLAARLFAGQTTNFRTQGGGFAPVIVTL